MARKVFHQRAIPEEIDIPTLQRYLHNAHTYFLDFRLPRLRRALIEAIIPADPTTKIPGLILRCYDEFVEEIRTHIAHENEGLFEEHEHDDERITGKLTEIKNLIIKYYPGTSSRQTGGVASAEKGIKMECHHLNGNICDNRASNLIWLSQTEHRRFDAALAQGLILTLTDPLAAAAEEPARDFDIFVERD